MLKMWEYVQVHDLMVRVFFYIESNDPKTNAKGGTEAGLYEMLQEYMIENESLR